MYRKMNAKVNYYLAWAAGFNSTTWPIGLT